MTGTGLGKTRSIWVDSIRMFWKDSSPECDSPRSRCTSQSGALTSAAFTQVENSSLYTSQVLVPKAISLIGTANENIETGSRWC